jgi:hypothetical protein
MTRLVSYVGQLGSWDGAYECLDAYLVVWGSGPSLLLTALNTFFCHQQKVLKCIKSIKNQQFMFRFHLVPLVLGELWLKGQNRWNIARRRQLEASHVARMAVGHQGQSTDAMWRRPTPRWHHFGPSHVSGPWDDLQERCGTLIQVGSHEWTRYASHGSCVHPSSTRRLQPPSKPSSKSP